MFDVWEDVPSASIRYNRAGAIQIRRFTDGNVSTAAEFNAVEGACGNGSQSPIIYDQDGSLFEDLGEDPSVIGFAGPCAADGNGQIVSGIAVMNGIYQDGIDSGDNFELKPDEFDAAFVHEFGHFSGTGPLADQPRVHVRLRTDSLAGLPTMFPFLHARLAGLAVDRRHRLDLTALPGRTARADSPRRTARSAASSISPTASRTCSSRTSSRAASTPGATRTGASPSQTSRATGSAAACPTRSRIRRLLSARRPARSTRATSACTRSRSRPAATRSRSRASTRRSPAARASAPATSRSRSRAPRRRRPTRSRSAPGETDSGNHVTLIGTPPRFDQFEGS